MPRRAWEGANSMSSKDHFLRMFAYDQWANRECVSALRAANAPAEAVGRMSHILSAERLWLERLRSERQSMPVWPTCTLQECLALADNVASAWRDYLSGLTPESFGGKAEYRNSKGELWTSRVEDVLMHVLMHSAYHRGQIALEMRSAGQQPAYTDFIHAVRQGFVE